MVQVGLGEQLARLGRGQDHELNAFFPGAFADFFHNRKRRKSSDQVGSEQQASKSLETELLDQAVSVFNRHGWTMSLSTETTRKFDRKPQTSVLTVILIIILLNILGIVLVILAAMAAQADHITLLATGRGYLLGMPDRERKQYEVRSVADLESLARYKKIGKNRRKPGQLLLAVSVVLILLLALAYWISMP